MKRLIFILYLCVSITAGLNIDDVTDSLAELLSISQTNVQICLNKTNVNVQDLMMMDQLVHDLVNDNVQTANIDNSALKVSCLFACMLQKNEWMVGTHINVEKIKEDINIKWRANAEHIALRNRILDICTDRVKSKNNECDVTLKLLLCIVAEGRRHENSNNIF